MTRRGSKYLRLLNIERNTYYSFGNNNKTNKERTMNIIYSIVLPKVVPKGVAVREITLTVDGVVQEPLINIVNMIATETQEFTSPKSSIVSATMVDVDEKGIRTEPTEAVEVVLMDLVTLKQTPAKLKDNPTSENIEEIIEKYPQEVANKTTHQYMEGGFVPDPDAAEKETKPLDELDEVGVDDIDDDFEDVDEDTNSEDSLTSEDKKLAFKFIRIEE